MQCPRDQTDLKKSIGTVDGLNCLACGGIFIQDEKFSRIIKHNGIDIAKVKAYVPDALACPHCDGSMRLYGVGPIEVDYCEKCFSVWLDKGELNKVNAYLEEAKAFREKLAKDPSGATVLDYPMGGSDGLGAIVAWEALEILLQFLMQSGW